MEVTLTDETKAEEATPLVIRASFEMGLFSAIHLDGDETVGWDDLTFREQRQARANIRALLQDNDAQMGDGASMDVVPSIYAVVRQRTEPEFELETALDMKVEEVKVDPPKEDDADAAGKRKPARRRSSSS
jgi:hypothetical protein